MEDGRMGGWEDGRMGGGEEGRMGGFMLVQMTNGPRRRATGGSEDVRRDEDEDKKYKRRYLATQLSNKHLAT